MDRIQRIRISKKRFKSFEKNVRPKGGSNTFFRFSLIEYINPFIATARFLQIKELIISRLHWGRGSFYKSAVHLSIIGITLIVVLSGLASRIANANSSALSGANAYGSNDLLSQGSSIQAILTSSGEIFTTLEHQVQPNETLSEIAAKYLVNNDTIRWFNPNLISPFADDIQVGWVLKIPASSEGKGINGVLYTVKSGQTLEEIVALTSVNNQEATLPTIIQFNNLNEPYTLSVGQQLFIPDGNLNVNEIVIDGIPTNVFSNPLADPSCNGYTYSRGYTFYHNGLDLARWPGCTIQAVASGVIQYVGCIQFGEGCAVKINHGGGIVTHYYHGNGTFYVRAGERIQQGQAIMEMGTTGNSTGVHLHFSLFKDGISVDPHPYVPY